MDMSSGKPEAPDSICATPPSSEEPLAKEDAWLAAELRALLYLGSMRIPTMRSLELTIEALRLAQSDPAGNPVADTMRSLRSILDRERLSPAALDAWLPADTKGIASVRAAPTVRRSTMVPVNIDRQPWITFIARYSRGIVSILLTELGAKKPSPNPADVPPPGSKPSPRGPR